MNTIDKIKKLNEWEFKLSAYNYLFSVIGFDNSTIAPKDGADYRNDRIAYFSELSYKLETDEEIKQIIKELANEDLDEVNKKKVNIYLKGIKKLESIPSDLYLAYQRDVLDSTNAWEEAKSKDDYNIFKPYLLKMIDYQKKFAHYRNPNINPYDVVLDDFEEGMNIVKYDEFFELLKKELLPLIKKINNKQEMIDDSCIYKHYDKEAQAKIMDKINAYLGFDKSWGYMGVSMHPFTNGFSNNDVRVTTFYDENNISSSIFSIIHEVGHGFYEHQMNKDYDGTILKTVSSGMHESQSRLFENYLGRSKAFVSNFYDELQNTFKENLENVSIDDFIKAINASKSSLIRTDADELTYPIHILIRYELEKAIMNEQIDLEHLDDKWNELYEEYLGIKAPSAKTGILQDIHWSDGSFGYFPTYALGSAVAAQIMNQMNKEFDVDKALSENNFKMITDYLKDKFQNYGALYNLDEILIKMTNEPFNPKYYIDYLKEKYTKLYDLDA